MENELNESSDPNYSVWLDEDHVIDYLLQWYQDQDDFYQWSRHNVRGINTEFLGGLIDLDNDAWLFTLNESLGYAGLAKIISIDSK